MRIAEVIGNVTMSRIHPMIDKHRWVIAVPFSAKALKNQSPPDGEDLVVLDEMGAGLGQIIGVSEGVEATMPFHPQKKPVDAYNACILDEVIIKE